MMKKLLASILMLILLLASPTYALAAILSLSPSTGTFNTGCSFALDINLDTQGVSVDGTDVILIYDNSRFSATSVNTGTIFAEYPGSGPDDAAGKVLVSGLASFTKSFSGTGTLATVNFTVKGSAPAGAAQVKFDFDSNNRTETRDSNVISKTINSDLLNSVVNGNYIIGTGTCASSSPAPSILPKTGGQGAVSTPSAEIPVKKTLDQYVDKTGKGPGTSEFTFTIAIVGSVLTVLGILGIALL